MQEIITGYLIPAGLVGVIWKGVTCIKKEIAKRPTFEQVRDEYRKTETCEEKHKALDEKVACLPEIRQTVTEIKTKLDFFIENGK